LTQLENGRIYRRIYYLEDWYVRTEGKFCQQLMTGRTLHRIPRFCGSHIHTSDTSSGTFFH
jgi:hypothetical protein